MPHVSGHNKQRGSGFGAGVMRIERVAHLLAQKLILAPAKRVEKESLVQAAPELKEVGTQKKTTAPVLITR